MRCHTRLFIPLLFLASLLPTKAFGPKAKAYVHPGARSRMASALQSSLNFTDNPLLGYSTYLGGKVFSLAIAVDQSGNAYITGQAGPGLPTTPGAFKREGSGAFVMKLNPQGSGVAYLTYLGPGAGYAIAVDLLGNAYVAGLATSADFPVTPGAFQTDLGGSGALAGHAFVLKLDATGSSLLYSTYLGGNNGDSATGIAIDSAGNAYVSGGTSSTNFPTTPGAFQSVKRGGLYTADAFVAKLNPTGSALVFSTYLGGDDYETIGGIAIDAAGNAYVTGTTRSIDFPVTAAAFQTTKPGGVCYTETDGSPFPCPHAFLTKFSPDGKSIAYSTYFGGTGSDNANAVAVDSSENAYVTGATNSKDLPTTAGALSGALNGYNDAFVTKFDRTASRLLYSTYLGGEDFEYAYGIALDTVGQVCVSGVSGSERFPTTPGAIKVLPDDSADVFVTKLSEDGSKILFSSVLGGEFSQVGKGVASDSAGNLYVTGYTLSSRFPTTPGAFRTAKIGDVDGFAAKFQIGPTVRSALLKGNKLIIIGDNFEDGAIILMDGKEQRTTNDDQSPATRLISKAGKRIVAGQSVGLKVRNPNGVISLEFTFVSSGK